jgi:hypothetical protein
MKTRDRVQTPLMVAFGAAWAERLTATANQPIRFPGKSINGAPDAFGCTPWMGQLSTLRKPCC